MRDNLDLEWDAYDDYLKSLEANILHEKKSATPIDLSKVEQIAAVLQAARTDIETVCKSVQTSLNESTATTLAVCKVLDSNNDTETDKVIESCGSEVTGPMNQRAVLVMNAMKVLKKKRGITGFDVLVEETKRTESKKQKRN